MSNKTSSGASPGSKAPVHDSSKAGTAAPGAAADWNAFSPARLWRDWIVRNEAQWSETVSQLLKDERTGDSLSRQISEMQLMHRQFSEFAQASLAAANMPSRTDLEALDERMGRLEDGLAQVAMAVTQLSRAVAAWPAGGQSESAANALTTVPRRTRRKG